LTLALGIGATTAIFSVVNAVLLRPLPYAQPEQLVRIYSEFPTFPNGGRRFYVAFPEFVELRAAATAWESIDVWATDGVNLTAGSTPTRVTGSFISGGMMQSLGVAPRLGRTIAPHDDVPGAPLVAVISHGLWQRAFGSSDAVIGQEVLVNGAKHTIVGVMDRSFQFPPGELDPSEIWTPLQIDMANPGVLGPRIIDRGTHAFNMLGRLKPEVTLQQARAELDSLVSHWSQTTSGHRFFPGEHTLVAYELHDEVVRGVKSALAMLMAAVGFLLLISCVNVANLLLARAEVRQRETAIRSALGASLSRLTMQFLSEGLVLSLLGGALGLLLAQIGVALFRVTSATSIPRAMEIGIDARVILFAITVSAVTCIAFGLAPLAHSLRRDLHAAMKTTGAATSASTHTQGVRQALIVCQIALALVLLMGTGLMLRAFWKLQQVDPGFEPATVTSMFVALPPTVPEEGVRSFWSRLSERVTHLPGIDSAALATLVPPIYPSGQMDTEIEGFVASKTAPEQIVDHYNVVSAGYFETLGQRVLEGRVLDERDDARSPRVAVVNEAMARMFWPDRSAVGRRVRPWVSPTWYTVVGVVSDAKNEGLDKPAGSELYFSHTQTPERIDLMRSIFVVVRAQASPGSLANAVRRAVAEIDPSLPVTRIRTMDQLIADAQSRPRFLTALLTLFATVALILAAVGIYGVISYSVAQRTRELGLRMALGAQPRDVLNLVLKRGVMLTITGLLIGIAGAWVLTRFLSGLLFGVTATDPATFATVSVLLGLVAIVASYLPARYATRVDPMVALRAE
jgi:predicted permease